MDVLDPFRWVSPDKYSKFWYYFFTELASGFWIRFFAFITLALGLWLLLARRNVQGGFMFIFISIFLTYGIGIIKLLMGVK